MSQNVPASLLHNAVSLHLLEVSFGKNGYTGKPISFMKSLLNYIKNYYEQHKDEINGFITQLSTSAIPFDANLVPTWLQSTTEYKLARCYAIMYGVSISQTKFDENRIAAIFSLISNVIDTYNLLNALPNYISLSDPYNYNKYLVPTVIVGGIGAIVVSIVGLMLPYLTYVDDKGKQ